MAHICTAKRHAPRVLVYHQGHAGHHDIIAMRSGPQSYEEVFHTTVRTVFGIVMVSIMLSTADCPGSAVRPMNDR
jgi:hypothetical protein